MCRVTKDGVRLREYRPNTPNTSNTLNAKVMLSVLEIIDEKCHYDMNGSERERLQSLMNRANDSGKDVFEVAETFGNNFKIYLLSNPENTVAFNEAINLMEFSLASNTTF